MNFLKKIDAWIQKRVNKWAFFMMRTFSVTRGYVLVFNAMVMLGASILGVFLGSYLMRLFVGINCLLALQAMFLMKRDDSRDPTTAGDLERMASDILLPWLKILCVVHIVVVGVETLLFSIVGGEKDVLLNLILFEVDHVLLLLHLYLLLVPPNAPPKKEKKRSPSLVPARSFNA